MKAFLKRWVFPVLAMSLLAACGGGGGGGTGGPTPASNEGTPSKPVSLGTVSAGSAPLLHAGSVAANGTSYYKFVTSATGTHEIALQQTSSDLWWNVYVVTDFSGTPLTICDFNWFATDEICPVDIPAAGTYYLNVINDDAIAGTYNLTITPPAPPVVLHSFNFDDGTLPAGWTTDGAWYVTTSFSNSQSYSVTDSPVGNYPDTTSSSLTTSVLDLTSADPAKPLLLKFYNRYVLEQQPSQDVAIVEVQANGGDFQTVAQFQGTQTQFVRHSIDLSPCFTLPGGCQNIVIRFQLSSDSDGVNADGWHIDDITIQQ